MYMLVRNLRKSSDYERSLVAQDENLRLAIQNDKNIADARKKQQAGILPDLTTKQSRFSEQILTDALEIKVVAMNNLRSIFSEEQAKKFLNGDGKTPPLTQEDMEYLNIFWPDLKPILQSKSGLTLKFFRDILKKSVAGRRTSYGFSTRRTRPAEALAINTPGELLRIIPRMNVLQEARKRATKIGQTIPEGQELAVYLSTLIGLFPPEGDRKKLMRLPPDKQPVYYDRFKQVFEGWVPETAKWSRALTLDDKEFIQEVYNLIPDMTEFDANAKKLYTDLEAEDDEVIPDPTVVVNDGVAEAKDDLQDPFPDEKGEIIQQEVKAVPERPDYLPVLPEPKFISTSALGELKDIEPLEGESTLETRTREASRLSKDIEEMLNKQEELNAAVERLKQESKAELEEVLVATDDMFRNKEATLIQKIVRGKKAKADKEEKLQKIQEARTFLHDKVFDIRQTRAITRETQQVKRDQTQPILSMMGRNRNQPLPPLEMPEPEPTEQVFSPVLPEFNREYVLDIFNTSAVDIAKGRNFMAIETRRQESLDRIAEQYSIKEASIREKETEGMAKEEELQRILQVNLNLQEQAKTKKEQERLRRESKDLEAQLEAERKARQSQDLQLKALETDRKLKEAAAERKAKKEKEQALTQVSTDLSQEALSDAVSELQKEQVDRRATLIQKLVRGKSAQEGLRKTKAEIKTEFQEIIKPISFSDIEKKMYTSYHIENLEEDYLSEQKYILDDFFEKYPYLTDKEVNAYKKQFQEQQKKDRLSYERRQAESQKEMDADIAWESLGKSITDVDYVGFKNSLRQRFKVSEWDEAIKDFLEAERDTQQESERFKRQSEAYDKNQALLERMMAELEAASQEGDEEAAAFYERQREAQEQEEFSPEKLEEALRETRKSLEELKLRRSQRLEEMRQEAIEAQKRKNQMKSLGAEFKKSRPTPSRRASRASSMESIAELPIPERASVPAEEDPELIAPSLANPLIQEKEQLTEPELTEELRILKKARPRKEQDKIARKTEIDAIQNVLGRRAYKVESLAQLEKKLESSKVKPRVIPSPRRARTPEERQGDREMADAVKRKAIADQLELDKEEARLIGQARKQQEEQAKRIERNRLQSEEAEFAKTVAEARASREGGIRERQASKQALEQRLQAERIAKQQKEEQEFLELVKQAQESKELFKQEQARKTQSAPRERPGMKLAAKRDSRSAESNMAAFNANFRERLDKPSLAELTATREERASKQLELLKQKDEQARKRLSLELEAQQLKPNQQAVDLLRQVRNTTESVSKPSTPTINKVQELVKKRELIRDWRAMKAELDAGVPDKDAQYLDERKTYDNYTRTNLLWNKLKDDAALLSITKDEFFGKYTEAMKKKGLGLKPKTFVEFGRFKLNENMLEEGVLQVKTVNGSPVPAFNKKIAISDTLQEILMDLIETKKLRGVSELDDDERRLIETLIIKAGLAHGLGVKKVHQSDEDAQKVKRFDLVKGIYEAGNNSVEVIHELRSLILYFIKTKRLNRKDGIQALQELQ